MFRIRVNGELLKLGNIITTNEELNSIAKDILTKEQYNAFGNYKRARLYLCFR